MPGIQEIDEPVLPLVKDYGKKLAHTIKTSKKVPPGLGVPLGPVSVNPVLLPPNPPAQCQWSIAIAVPNGGTVVQNALGQAQKTSPPPENPQAQNNHPNPPISQAELIPHPPADIPEPIQQVVPVFIPGMPVRVQHATVIPQAQNNRGPATLQQQNIPLLPPNNPLKIQQALPMFIPGMPVGVQHGLAIPQAQNNPSPANL